MVVEQGLPVPVASGGQARAWRVCRGRPTWWVASFGWALEVFVEAGVFIPAASLVVQAPGVEKVRWMAGWWFPTFGHVYLRSLSRRAFLPR